jgi:hypothetical protein
MKKLLLLLSLLVMVVALSFSAGLPQRVVSINNKGSPDKQIKGIPFEKVLATPSIQTDFRQGHELTLSSENNLAIFGKQTEKNPGKEQGYEFYLGFAENTDAARKMLTRGATTQFIWPNLSSVMIKISGQHAITSKRGPTVVLKKPINSYLTMNYAKASTLGASHSSYQHD